MYGIVGVAKDTSTQIHSNSNSTSTLRYYDISTPSSEAPIDDDDARDGRPTTKTKPATLVGLFAYLVAYTSVHISCLVLVHILSFVGIDY